MGLFSRFFSAAATSLDPRAAAAFLAAKIPFGNHVLTMIGVWLGA
jgi:hypothetical protein